jgi:hypothetical protein
MWIFRSYMKKYWSTLKTELSFKKNIDKKSLPLRVWTAMVIVFIVMLGGSTLRHLPRSYNILNISY